MHERKKGAKVYKGFNTVYAWYEQISKNQSSFNAVVEN